MAPVSLPPALEARLAALADRIRRQRAVRGASAFAVVVVLATMFLVLFDAAFALPLVPRCAMQVGCLLLVGSAGWRLIVKPYREELSREQLARRLEGRFPELGERLLALLGRVENAERGPGWAQFAASLARETEHRARTLNFTAAASARPVVQFVVASGLVLLLAAGMLAAMPSAGERIRRAWLPWYRLSPAGPYRVVVTSGNPVVRRGEAVTLTAYIEGSEPGNALKAVLVIRKASGEELRLPMAGDAAASFHYTLSGVEADLDYRVEVGAATSPLHTLLVGDPVELSDGCSTEIVSPPYAESIVPRRVISGLSEIRGLEHSTVRLALRFTRPAATAFLEWHAGDRPPGPGTVIPLEVAADRLSATATLSLTQNGTLRVVLANENGPRKLRTEVPIPVRAIADAPPRFEQISGLSARPRQVRPSERILVSFAASDDLGIGSAELEYAISPAFQPERIPISLSGRDLQHLEGRSIFEIDGRAAEGRTIRFRLRVSDARRFASPPREPQTTYFPPDGWAEFTVAASAPSLEQQEYFGQRDAANEALTAAGNDLMELEDELTRLRTETAGLSPLPVDHRIRIDRLRDRATAAANRLQAASQEAALTPDLRTFAARLGDAVRNPLATALGHLARARTDDAAERVAALAAAQQATGEARTAVAALLVHNARFAQYRIDRHRLALLAYDQAALADRAAGGGQREELHAQQLEMLKRLRTTVGASDPLLQGFNVAAGRKSRLLATETATLAAKLRELDDSAREDNARVRRALLGSAAMAQTDCAATAERVQGRFGIAARLPGIGRLRLDDYRKAADLIAQDKLLDALVEIETLIADGDRIAAAIEKSASVREDAKVAARQLAVWQADLRTRFVEATEAMPFAQLPEAVRGAFRTEQRAVNEALIRLRFPVESKSAHAAALTATTTATARLAGDGRDGAETMKRSAEALSALADVTPTVPTRLLAARLEFDRLRTEHESLHFTAEQIVRPFLERPFDPPALAALAKKLDGFAGRQVAVIARMSALDLPGFEHRQARADFALRHAAADLHANAPYDILASQQAVKWELDRLKVALDNPPALDDRAEELAAKQATIATQASQLGPDPSPRQLEALAFAQRDVQKSLEAIVAPEVPTLLHEAKDAVKLTDFREGVSPEELVRRTAAAAAALRRLADAVNGAESPLDRIRRLAVNRSMAAEEARRLAGSRFNPNASSEARRHLGRELEELAVTRVGVGNQLLKREVIKGYVELQKQNEPDRQYAAQKLLADQLGTMAARMADLDDLAFPRPQEPLPPAALPEDGYLPTKPLATELRSATNQMRAVRDRVKTVNADAAQKLKPLAERRAPREVELAAAVVALAGRLDVAARDALPADTTAKSCSEAAAELKRVGELLTGAAAHDRKGLADTADLLRAVALRQLDSAAARLDANAVPFPQTKLEPSAAATGEALCDAELAMREAAKGLEPGGNPATATEAAKRATDLLNRAATAQASVPP